MCPFNTIRNPKLVGIKCFACDSTKVKAAKEFDFYCTQKETIKCKCLSCGAEWFDDTHE